MAVLGLMVGDGGAGEGGDYSHKLDAPNLVIQQPATGSVHYDFTGTVRAGMSAPPGVGG